METTIKTTLAQKNLEMEKLEKTKKSHLRMISSSAARHKFKYSKTEAQNTQDTDARKIRMYETHFPGFCYLRNGEYRRKISHSSSSSPDPLQCSEKIKGILFTNNELDIYKTMCLHLLGTHIQNKNHIQRKDGRLCSYVKAQTLSNTPHTLQPMSQRITPYASEAQTKYDKMLPRYILDVKVLHGISTPSVKTYEFDSGSDEETKKKRKLQVPIYINNEIRTIINSVMEALEAVESSKLYALIELSSSPEELRNMLSNKNLKNYTLELAENPLVLKPTSYDYVMAHLMFDKIPEKGTLETVAQVLEVYDDSDLKISLQLIRRGILQKHLELMNSNILPQNKLSYKIQNKTSSVLKNSKISNSSVNSRLKYLNYPTTVQKHDIEGDLRSLKREDIKNFPEITSYLTEKENQGISNKGQKSQSKEFSRSVSINLEKNPIDCHDHYTEDECSIYEERRDSCTHSNCNTLDSTDSKKCDFYNLSNSQRILLGLKVASLKCKPINMHQFERKKKVDIATIINPIIHPHVPEVDYKQSSSENSLQNFLTPEKQYHKYTSKSSDIETIHLENLTRALLTNLRLEISETENKKRMNQFMAKISLN